MPAFQPTSLHLRFPTKYQDIFVCPFLAIVCRLGNLLGGPLFLTWHLHGSLPRNRYPPPPSPSAGKAFVWMDRYLDKASSGPTWLKREEIAESVLSAIQYAERSLRFYDLHAYRLSAWNCLEPASHRRRQECRRGRLKARSTRLLLLPQGTGFTHRRLSKRLKSLSTLSARAPRGTSGGHSRLLRRAETQL